MKKALLLVLVFTFSMFSISCEDEVDLVKTTSNKSDVPEIKNGRLCFESIESFKNLYGKFIGKKDLELQSYFDALYKNGFYSLRPIVTKFNVQFISEHYKSIILPESNQFAKNSDEVSESYADYVDAIEEIIGDDVFAALLNTRGEVQIADDIYKYTDVGLFMSKENKYQELENTLIEKNVSKDIKIATVPLAIENIKTQYSNAGVTNINSNVSYFKILYDPCRKGNPDSCDTDSGGGGTIPTPPAPNFNIMFNGFVGNLQNCNTWQGTLSDWLSSVFGDNNVCIDKYASRRRVKTKSFNYDYFFVYQTGIKSVHQYRSWTGWWVGEDSPQMRLNAEAIIYEYDAYALFNSALANNYTAEQKYITNLQQITLYQPNTINTGNFIYTNQNQQNLPGPFQNSGEGLTFEFFGTGLVFLDNAIQNGINNSLNANRLNSYFYDGLYSKVTTTLSNALNTNSYQVPANRTFIAKFPENGKVIVQKSHIETCNNTDCMARTFDWGVNIGVSTGNFGQSWNVSAGTSLPRPKNYRTKLIGAAQGDGAWHGSKIAVGID